MVKEGSPKTSPMMIQWQECKAKAKEALLLFRLGDFYEAFYEDAFVISKALDLTLTQRQQIPMCGVPFHASDSYVDQLIAKGFKVAIAEQMENPKEAKGLVSRDLVKIVTPGTLIDSSLLSAKSNNFFVALSQVGKLFGVTRIDVSTGEFRVMEVESQTAWIDELFRLKPSEVLVSQKFHSDFETVLQELSNEISCVLTTKENMCFDFQSSYQTLLSHFGMTTLDGLGLREMSAGILSAGALLKHLKEELRLSTSSLQKIETETLSAFLSIDSSCMRNLELFESVSSGKKQTLLDLLDQTQTPMGGRLLKQWLKHPLCCVESIRERQDAIQELLKKGMEILSLEDFLRQVRDLERLMIKVSSGYATPRDLFALKNSLLPIPQIREILEKLSSKIFQEDFLKIFDPSELTVMLEKALAENPPIRLSDGNIFKKGYHEPLDALRKLSQESQTWIASYQNVLREQTQIKTLKVGFTRAFGYFIEVSRGQVGKVPEGFQRRQTLVNGERFITEELKNFEHQILTAEDRILAIETELFYELRARVSTYATQIQKLSEGISRVDVLFSLAKIAKEKAYIRPLVDQSDELIIEQGRHPVIEAFHPLGAFIPNDTFLSHGEDQLLLITGPNMAGKSTYIRQVALIVILAQIGSFVPAKSAHIGVIDKIFSRIGASDDLARGQSTFMVEMTETAQILNQATSQSLIILDEIGRGTSTYDGIAIAWSVIEFLIKTEGKKAKTLFATHYSELTDLEKKLPGVKNYNIAVEEMDDHIVFLRKIVKGAADKSYGIHVARLAGVPQTAIFRAKEILQILENGTFKKKTCHETRTVSEEKKFPLFHYQKTKESSVFTQIQEEIKGLKLDQMTPIETWKKLFDIQQKLLLK